MSKADLRTDEGEWSEDTGEALDLALADASNGKNRVGLQSPSGTTLLAKREGGLLGVSLWWG